MARDQKISYRSLRAVQQSLRPRHSCFVFCAAAGPDSESCPILQPIHIPSFYPISNLPPLKLEVDSAVRRGVKDGSLYERSFSFCSSCYSRTSRNSRAGRYLSRYSQPDIVVAFSYHAANPSVAQHEVYSANTKNPHPRLHGMRCGSRAISMGSSTTIEPGQNQAHPKCCRSVLVTRDLGEQSSRGAG